jgi:hypothetical protein
LPTNGTVALTGTAIDLLAAVNASGAPIDRVGFYLDGQLLSEVFAAPYQATWQTSVTGARKVMAVATDVWGGSGTSAVATVAFTSGTNMPVTLVGSNSVWKYLDNGSDPGTLWKERMFNDSGWASGPAELGYGDAADGRPEATVLSYGSDATNKPMRCYFRREFVAESASAVTQFRVRLLRDDGAVVYLNGKPVLTNNMPSGAIGFATPALNTVSGAEEATFYEFDVDASALMEGTNVMAVEVHQSSAGSSDLSFDLALGGTRTLLSPAILRSPVSTNVAVGGAAQLSVWAGGSEPLSYRWLKDGVMIAGATGGSYGIANAGFGDAGRYTVAVSNALGSVVSAAALVGIVNDTNWPSAGRLMITKEGGAVRLRYRVMVGGNCELQRSQDLIGWERVTSAAVTANGVVEWVEGLPVTDGAYYRVREY